jgi:hypothetical protein
MFRNDDYKSVKPNFDFGIVRFVIPRQSCRVWEDSAAQVLFAYLLPDGQLRSTLRSNQAQAAWYSEPHPGARPMYYEHFPPELSNSYLPITFINK